MITETLTLRKNGKPSSSVPSNTTGFKITPVASQQEPDISSADLATERRRMIAEAAYYRAEQRGFGCGDEILDWLAAEQDIDSNPVEITDSA